MIPCWLVFLLKYVFAVGQSHLFCMWVCVWLTSILRLEVLQAVFREPVLCLSAAFTLKTQEPPNKCEKTWSKLPMYVLIQFHMCTYVQKSAFIHIGDPLTHTLVWHPALFWWQIHRSQSVTQLAFRCVHVDSYVCVHNPGQRIEPGM